MAYRQGPLSRIVQGVFALPFLLIGIATVIGSLTKTSLPGLVFGLVFGIIGLINVRNAALGGKSRESEVKNLQTSVALSDVRPQAVLDYRAPAKLGARRAAEVYAPVLATAPLPRLTPGVGRSLPVAASFVKPSGQLSAIAFAIVWTGLSGASLVAILVTRQFGGALFITPFVGIGVYVLVTTLKGVLSRMKLPVVELSEDPIFLGDELLIHVEQRGPAKVNRLQVDLVCREKVSYREGTDSRTEQADVYTVELLDEQGKKLGMGERWPHQMRTVLPTVAPHSFAAPSNSVAWLVRVRADIDNWPDYDEAFELRVLPRPAS
jgi:hypothetical protein